MSELKSSQVTKVHKLLGNFKESKVELINKTGISKSRMYRYLNRTYALSYADAIQISKFLEVNVTDIVDEDGYLTAVDVFKRMDKVESEHVSIVDVVRW